MPATIDKEQKKEYNKKYLLANREGILANKKQYRLLNKKKIQKNRKEHYLLNRETEINYSREYYRINKEKQNKVSRKWKKNNLEKVRQERKNYYLNNKEKENIARKKWRSSHKRKVKNSTLKQTYGITIEQFDKLLLKQKNKCGICNKEFTDIYPYIPSIDHVHDKTKRIRGLLCFKCNSALGLFNDNQKNLQNAINWIKGIKNFPSEDKKFEYIISKKYLANIKRLYNIGIEQYKRLLSENNNKCGICNNIFTKEYPSKPCIDHNHETDEIRGILCNKCNNALGFFKDNSEIITVAIHWIKGDDL